MLLKTINDLVQQGKEAHLIVYLHASDPSDRQFGILVWSTPYTAAAYAALCKWREQGIIHSELWNDIATVFWHQAYSDG